MDERLHQQAIQELIRKKFRDKEFLESKYSPQFPVSYEREYQRISNQYMRLLKECIVEEIQPLKEQIMRENGTFRGDGISDFLAAMAAVFESIGVSFKEKEQKFKLKEKIQVLAENTRRYSAKEWKKVVAKTLGVNIMEDYYMGDFFRQEMDKWVNSNVELIKSIPNNTLGEMKQVVREGFDGGKTATTVMKDIQKRYSVNREKAKFIARDQLGKLNADVTKAQQQDAGVKEYIWKTSADSRVREGHKHLNNKTFSWDDPPLVDFKNGRRCHPGQDYQCRCRAKPVLVWKHLNIPVGSTMESK